MNDECARTFVSFQLIIDTTLAPCAIMHDLSCDFFLIEMTGCFPKQNKKRRKFLTVSKFYDNRDIRLLLAEIPNLYKFSEISDFSLFSLEMDDNLDYSCNTR